MGVVITVDVVVGVLVHGARSRRRRTSQEENGREWHRTAIGLRGPPGGRKRAHGPGRDGSGYSMGVTCETPLQFGKNYIDGFHGFKFLPRRYTGDPPLAA